eukprot:COSAG05_NODE_10135_length_581_cov_1.263485_1_plen_79_part_10
MRTRVTLTHDQSSSQPAAADTAHGPGVPAPGPTAANAATAALSFFTGGSRSAAERAVAAAAAAAKTDTIEELHARLEAH